MKIRLILSAKPDDPLRKKVPFMPLSLAILAGTAPEHQYAFTDMLREDGIDYEEDIDLVGISVRMSAEEEAFRVADRFRKNQKRVYVIMGGPQASSNPFESKKHADAVVIGEGEKLWPVLLEDINNDSLKDFYVCSPVRFIADGFSVYQLDKLPGLDQMPVPRRGLFKKKYTFEMVYAARGCPVNCDFCAVTGLFGSNYRLRPVEDVVHEISQFKKYYYLIDDTVFGRPDTYDYYHELYDRIAQLKHRQFWTGQANLNAAATQKGQQVIKKAVKAGLLYAAIGMESINLNVLKKSGSYAKMGLKSNDDVIEKMKQNIRFIQDQGILISAWFTIGYEDDDPDTWYRTWDFCREMNLAPVFSPVHALKGTDLYERLKKEDKLQDHNTNITNVKHPEMSNQQIIQALEYVVKKGFCYSRILKRTWFLLNKFRKNRDNSTGDIIHKTIFAFITQVHMGKITRAENKKLRKKISL